MDISGQTLRLFGHVGSTSVAVYANIFTGSRCANVMAGAR
jgi:hypothetical protein